MKFFERIWKIIDGNKTIICMFVLFVLKLDSVENALPADLISALNWIVALGTGASVIHRVKKGNFTINKN